jgi:hypothetical protein
MNRTAMSTTAMNTTAMKSALATVVFVLGSVITCAGPGTSDSTSSSSGTPAAPEPIYGGETTDEAWRDMWDKQRNTTESAMYGANLVSPTEGASMAPTSPGAFVWTTTLAAAPAVPGGAPVRHVRAPTPWRVDFIPEALAHGNPVTGPVHWLRFIIAGRDDIHVFTTETQWTPTETQWAPFAATAGAEIRLEVVSAYMTQNRVVQGPYKAPIVRRFRVQ